MLRARWLGQLNKSGKGLWQATLDQVHGESPPVGRLGSSKQKAEAVGDHRDCEKVRSVDSGHLQPSPKPVCIHAHTHTPHRLRSWGLMVSSCTHRRCDPFRPGCSPSQQWCGSALLTGIIFIFSVVSLDPQDRAGSHLPDITASPSRTSGPRKLKPSIPQHGCRPPAESHNDCVWLLVFLKCLKINNT